MKFGVLKDIKNGEYRVVATPAEVSLLVNDGNDVYVASNAGYAAGFDDEEYSAAGAKIVSTNEEIWAECDFVAKVKEIEPSEYDLMREGQMIYCCIHPAAHREEVDALLEKKVIAITAEDSHRYGSPNCDLKNRQFCLLVEKVDLVYLQSQGDIGLPRRKSLGIRLWYCRKRSN